MHSARLIGTFERNMGTHLVYRDGGRYVVMDATTMQEVCDFPKHVPVRGQLRIWLLATGRFSTGAQ